MDSATRDLKHLKQSCTALGIFCFSSLKVKLVAQKVSTKVNFFETPP